MTTSRKDGPPHEGQWLLNLPLGRVLECGWCGEVVIETAPDVRVSYATGLPHVHLRLVKGGAA